MDQAPAHQTGRRARVVGLALVVLALAGACTLPPPYKGPAGAATVVVIGDSLVSFGSGDLEGALLSSGRQVSLYGEPGLDTRGAEARFVGASVAAPDSVVVVTTANDAFNLQRGLASTSQVRDGISTAFTTLDGIGCEVWILIGEQAAFYGFPTWAPVVNRMVVDQSSGRSNVRLVDWRRAAVDHPTWFQADQFHLTPAGNAAFASAITNALNSCPRPS